MLSSDSMFKPWRNGTNSPVYRILQCETCFRSWNRDISASFCISQIAEHQLVHNGLHPWRREEEALAAAGGATGGVGHGAGSAIAPGGAGEAVQQELE